MSEQEPLGSATREYGTSVPPVRFADFSPTELYSLSESIASSVNELHGSLRSLNKMLRQLGGFNDSDALRDNIQSTQQKVNGIVSATTRDLQRLSVVVRRGDKPQKLQVEKLTRTFKEAINDYGNLQQKLRDKMVKHMLKPRHVPPSPSGAPLVDLTAAEDEEATSLANTMAQARLVGFETSMLLEREAYMNEIETVVIDVNQIMAELADIVHSQGQTVDTVESQVEEARDRVEAGTEELVKASGYQNKYRRKLIILVVVAIIAVAILTIIIVKTV